MSARFAVGDRVRIARREEARHHRVPRYAQGASGVVERVCAAYGEPELLAYGGDGRPLQVLYRVRVPQTALWRQVEDSRDELEIEVFEHWLEDPEDPEDPEEHR